MWQAAPTQDVASPHESVAQDFAVRDCLFVLTSDELVSKHKEKEKKKQEKAPFFTVSEMVSFTAISLLENCRDKIRWKQEETADGEKALLSRRVQERNN